MPGVVGVFTAADLGLEPAPSPFNPTVARTILASDRVRYVGEPVVAVVAETREQATDAAQAVLIDYDVLEAVVDLESAVESSTILYDAAGSNVVFDSMALGAPDVTGDEYFADCEVTVSGRFVNQRVAPCPLEVRGSAATWIDGRLHQWASTQHAQGIKGVYVANNKLEPDQVRVRTPDVGGGFGAKIGTYPEEIVLGALAKALGRPVRWTETRSESMVGTRPRPGPGPERHHRRQPRRQGHPLPAAGAAGLRRLRRHGHDPRPVHDPPDVVGRLRDPQHRVPHDVGRHEHDTDRRLPRRRAPRGHRGHRAGDGPVRRRDRHGPGRGAAGQPDRRRSPSRTPRSSARPTTSATTSARSTGCSRRPATTELRAEQKAAARVAATRCSSASACRSTSRSPAASRQRRERQDRGPRRRHGHHLHRHVAARPGPRHRVVDDRQRPDRHPDRQYHARVGRHRPDARRRRHDGLALAAAGRRGRRQGRRSSSSTPAKKLAAQALEAAEADIVLDIESGAFHVTGTPAVSKTWAELAAVAKRQRRRADHRHPLRRPGGDVPVRRPRRRRRGRHRDRQGEAGAA